MIAAKISDLPDWRKESRLADTLEVSENLSKRESFLTNYKLFEVAN